MKIGAEPGAHTNTVVRGGSPARPGGRASTFSAVLLGLLSIFEVTFDMLSLVAAILGGIARAADSTSDTRGASNAPEVATGVPHQLASQSAAIETPGRRPVGVTIIAILLGLLGIFEFGFGLLALVTSVLGIFVVSLRSPAVGAALGVYYLLVGLVKLFFMWGLLRLQRWAFWATVFIAALSLLSSILAVTEPAATLWAFLPELLVPAAILVYFALDSNARGAFYS